FMNGLCILAFAAKKHCAFKRQSRIVLRVLFCLMKQFPGTWNVAPRLFETAPPHPHIRRLWSEFGRFAVPDVTLGKPTLQFQRECEVDRDRRFLTVKFDDTAKMKFAGARAPGLREKQSHHALDDRVRRRKSQCTSRKLFAFLCFAFAEEKSAEFG